MTHGGGRIGGWRSESRRPGVRLVEALPDIGAAIPEEDREMAERVLVVPVLSAADEDLAGAMNSVSDDAFDFVVLSGLVFKETAFARRSALELLGPGDVLVPPLSAARQDESRAVSRYLARGPTTIAVLDARFREAARRWPGLSDVLHDSLARQAHRASMHLAMLHLARVDARVMALFSDLAERFGRVTPQGVLIDVSLTHELIGRLVGNQRPTVSLALQTLANDGLLTRLEGGAWLMAYDPSRR